MTRYLSPQALISSFSPRHCGNFQPAAQPLPVHKESNQTEKKYFMHICCISFNNGHMNTKKSKRKKKEEKLTHWSQDKVIVLMSVGLGLNVDVPSNDS